MAITNKEENMPTPPVTSPSDSSYSVKTTVENGAVESTFETKNFKLTLNSSGLSIEFLNDPENEKIISVITAVSDVLKKPIDIITNGSIQIPLSNIRLEDINVIWGKLSACLGLRLATVKEGFTGVYSSTVTRETKKRERTFSTSSTSSGSAAASSSAHESPVFGPLRSAPNTPEPFSQAPETVDSPAAFTPMFSRSLVEGAAAKRSRSASNASDSDRVDPRAASARSSTVSPPRYPSPFNHGG